jgi:hypothetical protein
VALIVAEVVAYFAFQTMGVEDEAGTDNAHYA